MTEEDEYGIGKPVDDEYIDVKKRRADVSTGDEDEYDDNLHRSPESAQISDMSAHKIDMSHRFDDASGAGASNQTDELIDENAIMQNDGRAPTNTFFYVVEAPERKQQQFARMYRHQEGVGDPDRRSQNRPADNRRDVEIFCAFVELGQYQTERVTAIVEDLELQHMAHYSVQEVVLGAITLVANERGRFIRDEDDFKQLVEDSGSDMYTVKRVRQLTRRKSDLV